jgi:hypothetical protein
MRIFNVMTLQRIYRTIDQARNYRLIKTRDNNYKKL